MPYDHQKNKRRKDLGDAPKDLVGLLFMCYQSDIAQQFEHIQRWWCNWEFNFDCIIGQGADIGRLPRTERARNTEWPKKWASSSLELTSSIDTWPDEDRVEGVQFGRHVSLKGGEYFFAPSKPFLKNL
jgi:hypothetical protein